MWTKIAAILIGAIPVMVLFTIVSMLSGVGVATIVFGLTFASVVVIAVCIIGAVSLWSR